MKTRNFLILLAVIGVILFIILGNAKNAIYKFLNIETDSEKIARLTINNKQEKEALKEKEQEQKISTLVSKIDLNTTMTKDASITKLTNKIATLKSNIKLESNRTKILNHIKKEFKIEPLKVTKKKIKHLVVNKNTKTVKTRHKQYVTNNNNDISESQNKIIINRSTYLIYGYKDIKAICNAYKTVLDINKKDKK